MMKKLVQDDEFAPGRVILNDLELDPDLPLGEQIWQLKEDLLQVEFPRGRVLDVGWYPEFKAAGHFLVSVNEDPRAWNPVVKRRCSSIDEVVALIRQLATKIKAGLPLGTGASQ